MSPAELRETWLTDWPKGCSPPTGYVDWQEWAWAQKQHGLKQTKCRTCGLWNFPQEVCSHEPD